MSQAKLSDALANDVLSGMRYNTLVERFPDAFFERSLVRAKKPDALDIQLARLRDTPEQEQMKQRGIMRLQGLQSQLPPGFQTREQFKEYAAGWGDEHVMFAGSSLTAVEPKRGKASGWLTGGESAKRGLLRFADLLSAGFGVSPAKSLTPDQMRRKGSMLGESQAYEAGRQAYLASITDHDSWGHMLTGSAAGIGVGLATGGTGAGIFMGALVFGQSLGEYESIALASGDYDASDAMVYAGLNAVFETATEKVGIDALGRLGRTWAMSDAPLKRLAHGVVSGMVIEGVEEGVNQTLSELITPGLTNIEYESTSDILWNIASAAGSGAAMGGVYAPAFGAAGAAHRQRHSRRQQAALDRIGLSADATVQRVMAAATSADEAVRFSPEHHRDGLAADYARRASEAATEAGVASNVLEQARERHDVLGTEKADAYADALEGLGRATDAIGAAARNDNVGMEEALRRAVAASEALAEVSDIGQDQGFRDAVSALASVGSGTRGELSAAAAESLVGSVRSYEEGRDEALQAMSPVEGSGPRIIHPERTAVDLRLAEERTAMAAQAAVDAAAAA